MTRRVGMPWSLIVAFSVAFFRGMLIPPPTGRLSASEGALRPDSFMAGAGCCPVRARSVQGVQWSTTFRLAGFPPDGGEYFIFRNDSPH